MHGIHSIVCMTYLHADKIYFQKCSSVLRLCVAGELPDFTFIFLFLETVVGMTKPCFSLDLSLAGVLLCAGPDRTAGLLGGS